MKKVVYFTGHRSEFNLMTKTLQELNKHVDLTVIATAYHFDEGRTINEVRSRGLKIIAVPLNCNLNNEINVTAKTLERVSPVLERVNPDLAIVFGDRHETFACALLCHFQKTKFVHIGGGDITGNIDNKWRYGVTALADYHFTGCEESYLRLLGQSPRDIPAPDPIQVAIDDLEELIK